MDEQAPRIVVLTGAGISAESGLATFRGEDGLWEGHRVEDVATPEAFQRDPTLVHKFYNARRAQLGEVEPNAAHRALAKLEADWPGEFLLVTQNVDDLHERAGSKRLIHMHGRNTVAWCQECDARSPWDAAISQTSACPECGKAGTLRPDIVWFGEMPYELEAIEEAVRACDLLSASQTSGAVYPAAGYVQTARYCGARTLEMNLDPSLGSYMFDESRTGPAGELVPTWVDEVLGA